MTHILFYSICAVAPVFITGRIIIEENECIFSRCFIKNLEEIESLKNEKSPEIVLEFCFPISVRTLVTLVPDLTFKVTPKLENAQNRDSVHYLLK